MSEKWIIEIKWIIEMLLMFIGMLLIFTITSYFEGKYG